MERIYTWSYYCLVVNPRINLLRLFLYNIDAYPGRILYPLQISVRTTLVLRTVHPLIHPSPSPIVQLPPSHLYDGLFFAEDECRIFRMFCAARLSRDVSHQLRCGASEIPCGGETCIHVA